MPPARLSRDGVTSAVAGALLAIGALAPAPAAAQHPVWSAATAHAGGEGASGVAGTSGTGLGGTVMDLFRFGDCSEPLCLPVAAGVHGEHYIPALVQGRSNLLGYLTNAIGASVANVPISGTSSGALFRFENGRPVRENVSGGPIFAERARTLGRGRLFVGANMSGFDFQTLRGVPLDGLTFNFTHQDVPPAGLGDPGLENDVIQVTTQMDVSVLVSTIAATYGLLDRVDVGVAVPLVRTAISGHSRAQVIPFGPDSPHVFGSTDDPRYTADARAFGSAFGVGDVAARVKARLMETPRTAVAVVGEARFPTGREEDLLGAGHMSWRALGVASARYGAFSPHVNLGYLGRRSDVERDAFLATAGFDHLLAPFATLAVDVLSRWQMGDNKVLLPEPVEIVVPFHRVVEPSNIPERRDDALDASLGLRLTTSDGITFVTNALVPIRRTGGLQPAVAWTAGLEYTF